MVDHVTIQVLPDGRVARADAATYLGLKPKTLADWSGKGIGPLPRKVGGRVFYFVADLEAFAVTGAREAA